MTTTAVGTLLPSNTAPSSTSSSSSSSLGLNTTDFMNMMMTQLQNQDPLNPTSSDSLMSEMSQIGQMQSTAQLQTTLQNLATQTQIGAASGLIGKKVTGLDVNSNPVTGSVNSVQVTSTDINLQLDGGATLALSNVSTISPAAASATSGG
jgi:flagellar basal-body rod modification protein FlgD